MLDALRSDLFRQRRRWMPKILVIVFALLAAVIYIGPWIGALVAEGEMNRDDFIDLRVSLWVQNVVPYSTEVRTFFGIMMTTVLAGSSVGGEYSSGTVRTIVVRTRARWHYVAAKLATVGIFAALLTAAGLLMSLGLAAAMTPTVDGNFDGVLTGDFSLEVLSSFARSTWTAWTYGALTVLLAIWTRSTAVGIAGALGVLFLEPLVAALLGLSGSWVRDATEALPGANLDILLHANGSIEGSPFAFDEQSTTERVWRAAAVLGGYLAFFIALAIAMFRRRDITTE